MRDHLLGCRQFVPDVEAEAVSEVVFRMWSAGERKYPLGVPHALLAEYACKKNAHWAAEMKERGRLVKFECGDATPEHMKSAFPHEYDLDTMLADAADRKYGAGMIIQYAGSLTFEKLRQEHNKMMQEWVDHFTKGAEAPKRRVLTEADAEADARGEPRPDNPSAAATAMQMAEQQEQMSRWRKQEAETRLCGGNMHDLLAQQHEVRRRQVAAARRQPVLSALDLI